MELTKKYLESVNSITLQHFGCDCEVKGEWVAQDGDAILIIDKCDCSKTSCSECFRNPNFDSRCKECSNYYDNLFNLL